MILSFKKQKTARTLCPDKNKAAPSFLPSHWYGTVVLDQPLRRSSQEVNILLSCILCYIPYSPPKSFGFSMYLVSSSFKCHHIIFIGIKSQMNHKPMKTACLFADYRQFVLGNGPEFLFPLSPLKSQSLSAAFWNLILLTFCLKCIPRVIPTRQAEGTWLTRQSRIEYLTRIDGLAWLYKKPPFSP